MKKNAKKSRQHHELKLNLSPTRKKSSAKKPRSLEHQKSDKKHKSRPISPVNDFSGIDEAMSASSDDSISKGSSPSVKTGSRSKNHSEQLLKNAKKKVKLVKLPKSSGSSRIDVDYSPNQIPP